jgi:hypothetical protein
MVVVSVREEHGHELESVARRPRCVSGLLLLLVERFLQQPHGVLSDAARALAGSVAYQDGLRHLHACAI